MPPELGLKVPGVEQASGLIRRETEHSSNGRIVIISYRLPVVKDAITGKYKRTIGGMAGALRQALTSGPEGQTKDAVWYGWLGETGERQGLEDAINPSRESTNGNGYTLQPVDIPEGEFKGFYFQGANMGLWPGYHGYELKVKRNTPAIEEGWESFESTNRRFAEAYMHNARPGDNIFVQDYQLPFVGKELKKLGFKGRISHFLHIPFPNADTFFKIPHAQKLLEGLLQYDRIGFQTLDDLAHFNACVRALPNPPERLPLLEATPIGIDTDNFINVARQESVLAEAHHIRDQYPGQKIMFTGGRLDYTKGFVESILAYYRALKRNPHLRETTTFVVAAPLSRKEIPDYEKYGRQLEIAMNMINKKFGTETWKPVHVIGELSEDEIVAHFLAADVNIAGSRADGMNLTPKEATAACSTKELKDTSALIISNGAGVSRELKGALMFEPKNLDEQAAIIAQAFGMPFDQRIARRKINEAAVFANTIDNWAGRGNLYFKPRVKEIDSQKRIAMVWSDLDGTANDEKVPEGQRMGTIEPAREAFSRFELMRLPVGLISARGTGEVEAYQDALDVNGPIIAEDGQVLVFPKGIRIDKEELPEEFRQFRLFDHEGRQAMLLSHVGIIQLKTFTQDVLKEAEKRGIANREDIYSSLTKPPEELIISTGHESMEFVRASVDRLGSGYFDKVSQSFLDLLNEMAPPYGIRVIGDTRSASIYGVDSNKGNALRIFDRLAEHFFPDVEGARGTTAVAFGNGRNDLAMFAAVHANGGIPILIGDGIPANEVPEYVLRAAAPHGYGILQSTGIVTNWLNTSSKPEAGAAAA